jgi:cob(I)alamin adenosyltransferase
MKIYTKTGDQGQTGLLGGDRIHKESERIEAIGTIDELNAYVGVCIASISDPFFSAKLTRIQNQLFDLGSELACPPDGKFEIVSVSQGDIELLEREIDEMDEELPPLKSFILPGGTLEASHLHFLRAICRRAERTILVLHRMNPVRNELIMYVNRLSDWIFCFSRLFNLRQGVEEQKWSKGVK